MQRHVHSVSRIKLNHLMIIVVDKCSTHHLALHELDLVLQVRGARGAVAAVQLQSRPVVARRRRRPAQRGGSAGEQESENAQHWCLRTDVVMTGHFAPHLVLE